MATEGQSQSFEKKPTDHRFIGHKNEEGYSACARCNVHENDRALQFPCPGPPMSDVILDLMRQNAKAEKITLDEYIRRWLDDAD